MATGSFFGGYAPNSRSSGNAGAASIFLTPVVAKQNATVTAVLMDLPSAASSISFKALIYDGAHSALLATGSVVTSLNANYNRLPLTANLAVTAGSTYYVGYVCANSLSVTTQVGASISSWFVSGGQNVTTPANPLVGGASNSSVLMIGLELDGTGLQGYGWGPDFSAGVTRSATNSATNTVATFAATGARGVRGVATNASTGKYYFEVDVGGTVNNNTSVGIASANCPVNDANINSAAAYRSLLFASGSRVGGVSLGLSFVSGDTVGVAYDAATGTIWWNKNNGSWFGASSTAGSPASGTGGYVVAAQNWPMSPLVATEVAVASTYGLRDTALRLKYAPPAGFVAWSPDVAPTDALLTQIANEQWINARADARLTQIFLEHWGPAGTSQPQAVLTQMALEHWYSVAAPTTAQARAWILA